MGAARELISLAIAFWGAGFLAGWIVVPRRIGPVERLFLSLALAVPATLLAAAPGAATHSLAAWNLAAGFALLLALASWRARWRIAAALSRGRPHLRRPRAVPVLLACIALAGTWFAVLVPQGIGWTDRGDPNGTIVYYHWGIVGKVVEDGGLPATLPEWGKPREFPYEYAFSAIHGAATADLAGEAGFVLEEHYRLALVLFAFCAALALWRRWLPPWWAWLAAVLTMNVSRVETRLLVYKPEAFAFILVLWSAWLLDEALARRSRRWGAMAGAVLATSFLAHPVGSLLVAPLWGGILLGRALPAWRARRSERAGRRRTAPRPILGLRALLPAVVVFALLFGGLRTAIGSTGQDLSQSDVDGVDLTRVVYNLGYVSSNPFARPQVPECSHPFGVYSTQRPFFASHAAWFYFDLNAPSSLLLILGGLLVSVGALLLCTPPQPARWPAASRGFLTWAFYALGVYLLALLICHYYSTWVPERVGPMRLMPYWALIFPGLIAALAWAVAALVSRWAARETGRGSARPPLPSPWLGAAVAPIPAIAVSVLALWTFTAIGAGRDAGVSPFRLAAPRAGGLAPGALDAYRWASRQLPADALILTNGYIEGALGMISHRTGVLDGRAPFAQPDPWRAEAIDLLERSRAYFRRPADRSAPGGAGFVLVGAPDVNLGGTFFPTNFAALDHDPALRLLYRSEGVSIYRVLRPGNAIGAQRAERRLGSLLAARPSTLPSC